MGRIEESLRKAKGLSTGRRTDTVPGQNSTGDTTDRLKALINGEMTPALTFAELHRNATYYALDADVLQRNRITSDQQSLSIRSAYKMLRTRLSQRMRANNWNTIAVSSARAGAGKTLTAINTAISLAHEPNQNVILVDLDLRRSGLCKYLGIEPRFDISDYLQNDVPIGNIVIKTDIERLLIIPNRTSQENSSELLISPAMLSLVWKLSHDSAGTIVIFDLPPMLDADDMLAFSPYVDALLFVVADCETKRADLQQVKNLVEDLNVLGVVLNKSSDTSPAYY
jgi:protein-tyrosine kinase